MINTVIFEEYNNYGTDYAKESCLKSVNKFLEDRHISRSDIVEYKTDIWNEDIGDGCRYYNYRVILSYYK